MIAPKWFRRACFPALYLALLLGSLLVVSSPCCAGQPAAPVADRMQLGERMYREGILPSGEPMAAMIKGDLPVSGTTFSCVSCHLRSGLGSVEGGVVTPPTNGATLYKPQLTLFNGVEPNRKYFPIPPKRPAYTDETLADLLRGGVDPGGYVLNEVMPRYLLEDGDMAVLIDYLKKLSTGPAPGVSADAIQFATVVTDDVSAADRDAMLLPLKNLVAIKNAQARAFANPNPVIQRTRRMAEGMLVSKEMASRKIFLSVWELKGAPQTWRAQLEEYLRREPVFALLGGISNQSWEPIHRFCEDKRLPCLFPVTEYPVISEQDWYTLYFSKGHYQEGESAARFLRDRGVDPGGVLQIVRDTPRARALAAGFLASWKDLGFPAPKELNLKQGEKLTPKLLKKKGTPSTVVLWDGDGVVDGLKTLASGKRPPKIVVASGTYLGADIWTLPESLRATAFFTYPYRMPGDIPNPGGMSVGMKKLTIPLSPNPVTQRSNYTAQVLNMVLVELKGNYYPDYVLDIIGMMEDQEGPLYQRLSFGPGQRYASKGCYVVQLSGGSHPSFIRRSEWVIP